ncbi:hypothetical protein GCM10007242_44690 [Pigmentiphaga litoralis]|uniref:DUF3168 domain-containing protein n=1 Tax=Pigmentiphaga litoralis TaxID=516702 RepID=UPI00167A60B0|nr:DUF3168 domain-containing protein [Pigmentiphaga litoralis]GGX32797.1 hypothetical protein GCM10007242_44690 [Pigmentiphaga litoralis]
MAVEQDIIAAVGPLVGGRLFPDVAPPGTQEPYATFQQIGGQSLAFLESKLPDLANGRFQLNVWSRHRSEASTIARQIERVMVESPVLRAEALGGLMARYESATQQYGAQQDFSIWFRT